MIEVRVVGDRVVAADLREKVPAAVHKRIGKSVRFAGRLLRTKIQANASGRPGPNAPTGDYRRSWGPPSIVTRLGMYSVEVGTNAPQGRRLEFGYHGVDSLGRHYDQPPFPHVGPAADSIAPTFAMLLEKDMNNL